MKLDCSAESWLKFFTSAGIPVDSARTYAVTFSKNEIQLDMLSEIKKEYLVDMGISLMGHIIAILRHAKTVYEENVTKSTLSSTSSKNQTQPVKVAPKEKPVLKTMPLRIASEKEVTPATSSTVIKSTVASAESRLRAVGTSTVQSSTYGPHPKPSSVQVPNKELPPKKKDSEAVAKTKITSVVSSTTFKKKTTGESVIHRQHEEVSNSKGKVFERLGEEVYSAEVKPSETPSESSSSSNESVFTRLGGKISPTYSPCSSPVKPAIKPANGDESFSDFPKIKRVIQNGNKAKLKSMMCTMRADEAELQAKRGQKRTRSPSPDSFSFGTQEFNLLKSNIKSRLGRMPSSTSPSPARFRSASVDRSIGLRSFGEIKSDKTVKSRLGTLNFNRLDERDSQGFRGSRSSKGSILSKRLSPVKSIALSGLSRTNSGIKSRLRQSELKTSSTQKKVSFGPVQQQLIPLETKPTFRRQFNRNENFGRYGIFGLDWKNQMDYDLY